MWMLQKWLEHNVKCWIASAISFYQSSQDVVSLAEHEVLKQEKIASPTPKGKGKDLFYLSI